jgi:NhaA family Na+:H+ antiporter
MPKKGKSGSKKNRGGEALRGMFHFFVHSEVAGSVILLACTITALVWANSPWASSYFDLAHTKIGISWGGTTFALSLQHWINDGLMALFFFVVGLEIKREILVGRLSSWKKAVLPVSAAVGGMVFPALAYFALNFGGKGFQGWGIPMATDIAFALGILALFGKRAPLGLKVFLTALAIADDLGAVLVIALFYTEQIRVEALLAAGGLLFLLLLANRFRPRNPGIHLALGAGVWLAVFSSGVHATVAGILVAMIIPVRSRIDPKAFFKVAEARLKELRTTKLSRESMIDDRAQLDAVEDLHQAADGLRPSGLVLEHALHPFQALFILPLFALFNAGVSLGDGFLKTLVSPVSLGILAGLIIGKQVGITLFGWIAVKSGHADLPDGVTWRQLYGVACLAGVGFTMSLFISDLAFASELLINQAKVGILAASLLSGVWGFLVLQKALPKR